MKKSGKAGERNGGILGNWGILGKWELLGNGQFFCKLGFVGKQEFLAIWEILGKIGILRKLRNSGKIGDSLGNRELFGKLGISGNVGNWGHLFLHVLGAAALRPHGPGANVEHEPRGVCGKKTPEFPLGIPWECWILVQEIP